VKNLIQQKASKFLSDSKFLERVNLNDILLIKKKKFLLLYDTLLLRVITRRKFSLKIYLKNYGSVRQLDILNNFM